MRLTDMERVLKFTPDRTLTIQTGELEPSTSGDSFEG